MYDNHHLWIINPSALENNEVQLAITEIFFVNSAVCVTHFIGTNFGGGGDHSIRWFSSAKMLLHTLEDKNVLVRTHRYSVTN